MELDDEMAEFCGVLMGDGNIWTNGRKYEITITGSPKDRDYMDKIAEYTKRAIKPVVYYRVRGRGLRLTIYSKNLFGFLAEVGIQSGSKKNTGGMPRQIAKNRRMYLAFMRGFFDTDGSIFTSAKKGVAEYPTIEITNENPEILQSILELLRKEGFRTTFRKSNSNTYKIAIHGNMMVRKWMELIGSSHPRKRSKMELVIKRFTAKEN